VDKKKCPQCGKVQAYKEVVERRKHCEVCKEVFDEEILYAAGVSWNKVKNNFLRRQRAAAEVQQENEARIEKEEKENMVKMRHKPGMVQKVLEIAIARRRDSQQGAEIDECQICQGSQCKCKWHYARNFVGRMESDTEQRNLAEKKRVVDAKVRETWDRPYAMVDGHREELPDEATNQSVRWGSKAIGGGGELGEVDGFGCATPNPRASVKLVKRVTNAETGAAVGGAEAVGPLGRA
jgi:hypothetical protein